MCMLDAETKFPEPGSGTYLGFKGFWDLGKIPTQPCTIWDSCKICNQGLLVLVLMEKRSLQFELPLRSFDFGIASKALPTIKQLG